MTSAVIKTMLACILFSIYSISLAQQPSSDKKQTLSEFRLKQKMESISSEISKSEASIVATEAAIRDLNNKIDKLKSVQFDFSSTRESIRKLHVLLQRWASKNDDSNISKIESYNFREYSSNVTEYILQPINRIIRDISNYYFPSSYRRSQGGDFAYLRHYESVLRGSSGELEEVFDRYRFGSADLIVDLRQITESLDRDSEGIAETKIGKIRNYLPPLISKLDEQNESVLKATLEGIFNDTKNAALGSLGTLVDNLKKHNQDSARRIESLDQELLGYDREYQAYAKQLQKSKELTNSYESLSVNFMIGGIILILMVLLMLSRGDSAIADKLIERRTLVEILSMGFLLLAVIILGTSDKINAETLGTLLGTIAGYVFGKQMSERLPQNREVYAESS